MLAGETYAYQCLAGGKVRAIVFGTDREFRSSELLASIETEIARERAKRGLA